MKLEFFIPTGEAKTSETMKPSPTCISFSPLVTNASPLKNFRIKRYIIPVFQRFIS